MAKAKDLTVTEKLEQLFELQKIDSQLDQIQIMKGELPMEVRDLEDELAGLNTRIQKLAEGKADTEHEIARHRANIKESEMLIERYQQQLDVVKNNREYEALSKEIEMQKLEIQLSEKRIREATENLEAKDETLSAAQGRLDVKQKDLDNKKVELEKIIEKTEAEETKLQKAAEKQRKGIEERLLRSYDRIRSRYRNGLAVVTIERDACGGCYNKIPPQLQLEIRLRKNIAACEHCGRVIVDTEIAGVHEQQES